MAESPTRDYTIQLWDVETREEIRRLAGHEGPVTALHFSPDGSTLISGSIDESLRLWNVATGQEIRRFDGHTGGVLSLDISANGRFAISGAQDSNVMIWDVARGDLLRQFTGHNAVVNGVAFRDDTSVWSASEDGVVYRWAPLLDLQELQQWTSDHRLVRPLTCSEQELYLLASNCTNVE
jgi:WD40 repeat protein